MDRNVEYKGEPIEMVFSTKDYSQFKKMKSNRTVSEKRISSIVDSMREGYILNPIIVNEKYEIVEGQGRYEACKRLSLPVNYILVNGLTINDCSRLNRCNTPWSQEDWVTRWADDENWEIAQNYDRLLQCVSDNKVPISRALFMAGRSGSGQKYNIQNGKLIFTPEDAEKVRECAEYGRQMIEALQITKRVNDAFWKGIRIMIDTDGFDKRRMIRNCIARRNSFSQMGNLAEQLMEFTKTYNFRTKGEKLYFEDYMRNKGTNVRTYMSGGFKEVGEDASTLNIEDEEE